ncbi:M48 family metalloprotease [Micromonospora sp. NPDC049645]|uniref:M48 family metalloprotease n=1 Tax=Micromonospora sp. NPDC049645 TaxID=3155508 RepID=UPI00341442BB
MADTRGTSPSTAALTRRPGGPPPTPLLWLYLQVTGVVAGVGVAAGSMFFFGHRPLAQPYAQAMVRCSRTYDVDPSIPGEFDATRTTQFLTCMSDPARVRGLVMLTGGVLLVVGLALIVALTPVVDRWRLRRHRLPGVVAGAEQRFAELCDRQGLYGRHRPRLFVAGPSVRQAFTTVRPGGRPLVVLPAAVAVGYRDPARFDPVVQHELAHVQGRDVRWVSAVRGLLWLVVPAVVVAGAAEIRRVGLTEIPVVTVGRALVLVLLSALLRALVLRLREHEADQQVSRTGDPSALVRLLDAAAATRPHAPGRLRQLFARHPTPQRRAAALRGRQPVSVDGPMQAAVTGAVTGIVAGAASQAGILFAYDRDLSVLTAGLVGVLFGFGLTPALHRRALSGAPSRRWLPVVAAAAGLAVGGFLFPSGTSGGGASFPTGTASLSVSLRFAIVVALAGVVAGTACTLLAGLAARRGPDRFTRLRRGLTYLAASATVTAVCWPLQFLVVGLERPVPTRAWLVYALPDAPWPWLALALPTAVVALIGWRRFATRAVLSVMAVTGLIGAGLASAQALRNPPATLDAALSLLQQREWICALAGWATLVVLATGRGDLGMGRALGAGAGVAGLTGTSQFVHEVLSGRTWDATLLRLYVGVPVIWWLYLAVLTMPILLGLSALTGRLGRRPGLIGRPTHHPDTPRRVWPVVGPATAALLVAAAAVIGLPGGPVLLPTAAPTATGPPVVATPSPTTVGPSVSASPGGRTGADPGRILTVAQAGAAAGAVRAKLPAFWKPEPQERETGESDTVVAPPACRRLARDDYLRGIESDKRVDEIRGFATRKSPNSIRQSTVIVIVTSYAHPVPDTLVDEAEAARAACSRFTATVPGGSPVRFTVRAQAAPQVGEESWRVRYDLSLGSGSTRITGTTLFGLVRVGHNLVLVQLSAVAEPLDEAVFEAAVSSTVAVLSR